MTQTFSGSVAFQHTACCGWSRTWPWQAQDAIDLGLRGCRSPAMQKKRRGTVHLGGVLCISQPSLTVPKLVLCICCIIFCVPFAHTCKEPELVALQQTSYLILAPMVSSNFPPKGRLPCWFQSKYIFSLGAEVSLGEKVPVITSGEAGTCPAAMAE